MTLFQICPPIARLLGRSAADSASNDRDSRAAAARPISTAPLDQILRLLDARLTGLTDREVRERLDALGPNTVARERRLRWWVLLVHAFANPFIAVLAVIGLVSLATGDTAGAVVVAVMVGASALTRFVQEYRSSSAAETLKRMVRTTVTVTRQASDEGEPPRPERREVGIEEIVPGDIVHLSAGDVVPADLRLVTAKDLFVTQATLTGEAIPVEKFTGDAGQDRGGTGPFDDPRLCFMGTSVVSGSATAVVVTTGARTCFGALAKSVVAHRALTSFDKGVNQVTWVLIRFMALMVPVVFLLNGLLKHDFKEAFLFAIAVAVGLTPEMLPMVVTANLARGAVAMSRRKVIVKRLNAIQNLGAMDVLCTDKTGTLTEDRVVLEKHVDPGGATELRVLELAYLNSYYQTGLRNLLDRAVLAHADLKHELDVLQHFVKLDEVPFDFARRRMSVVVAGGSSTHTIICKGAVEETLDICTHADRQGQTMRLTPARRDEAQAVAAALNADGFRVVAVAYRRTAASQNTYTVADEHDLTLAGFIAFLDPPKASAREAIAALHAHGVRVVVLTGDNDIVTRGVCRQVGLPVGQVVLGPEIDAMSDAALAAVADATTVFAKLNPTQKARIITALQAAGHTVGYLGDGINDAPALRHADVGVSVDSAADIARDSADIILLEKNLLVLEEGVVRGREVYGNIIKYLKMTASSNFGNVFSVLIASAVLPFLPMLPIQLLVQNLLYDFSQLALPWDRMDAEFTAVPRRWDAGGIARFMVWIGPLSSVFDVTTFALLWWVFGANVPARQALFQSGWFIEGLASQTLIVHLIRTRRIPFLQSTASAPVLLLTTAIVALGVALPFLPIGRVLGMVPPPVTYFPWLVITLVAYVALVQVVKSQYIRRFDAWL